MSQKIFILLASAFGFFVVGASSVVALSAPEFPSCVSPVGSLQASYESGVHGIAGQSGEFEGKDAVYSLGSGNYAQCFCPPSGSGIQSNWWKIASLSQEEIDSFRKLGWIYVPSGSAWGLDPDSYLVMNQNYSCLGGGNESSSNNSQPGPGGAPVCDSAVPPAPRLLSVERHGASAVLTWSKVDMATTYAIFYGTAPGQYIYGVPSTGNVTTYTINSLDVNKNYYFSVVSVNNCMPSSSSATNAGGQVLGASTQVLGLANTGTTLDLLLAMAVFGLSSLAVIKYRA